MKYRRDTKASSKEYYKTLRMEFVVLSVMLVVTILVSIIAK